MTIIRIAPLGLFGLVAAWLMFARPPIDLHRRIMADAVQRNDRRVVALRIVFRRQLHVVGHVRLAGSAPISSFE